MYQDLGYDIENVMPEAVATGLFVSLFTAQQPRPTQGPTGAVAFDYIDVDPFVNIPCTAPPESPSSITATEVRALQEITSSELHHVLLNGYYPDLDAGWRGENTSGAWICSIADNDGSGNPINPVQYEISGVESDSQRTQTRVRVKLATV